MRRITAKYVYTLDGAEPIRDGYVEVDDGGMVTGVGRCARPAAEDAAADAEAEYFDGILTPGFVNAHCHVELSHLQGRFSKGSGMAGFIDQINSLRDCVSAEEKKTLLQRQMDGMWDAGVSAMADISNGSDSFQSKSSSRMYTRTFIEVFGTEPQDCDGVIASARELRAEALRYGLDASVTPHSCYTTSPQLLSAAAAEGLGTGFLSYHSQESPQEEEMIGYGRGEMYDNRIAAGMSVPPATGTSSLEYFLGRLAAMDRSGEERARLLRGHVLLVHNVCLTPEAAQKALEVLDNVWWALCPCSNIFIHNALPPVPMMRELGLDICLGTDSLSSNDSLDMIREMLCMQENFPEVPLGEILEWACLNGARFLGRENELGRMAPGMRPGIVGISAVTRDCRLTGESRSRRLV